MAHEGIARLLAFLNDQPSTEGLDINTVRAQDDAFMLRHFPVPPGTTVTAVTADGVPCEWVVAPDVEPARTIYYIHGGGFLYGSAVATRELAARLSAAAEARVLLVDYRLAPEHPYPAAVDDVLTAYRWLLEQGTDPRRIVVAGESAGGGLTMSLLVAARDAGLPLPASAVPLCPWVDLTLSGDSLTTNAAVDPTVTNAGLVEMVQGYLGDRDTAQPLASPLLADLSGLPPLLIYVGSIEILLDDALQLAKRVQVAGGQATLEVWPEMIHNWMFYAAMLPEGQQAIDQIGAFVVAQTGGRRNAPA